MGARKNANIADAVVKLLEARRKHGKIDRILETIALSIERDGDPDGAARIRAEADPAKEARGFVVAHSPPTDALQWFRPEPLDGVFIAHGGLRTAMDRLVEELALASSFVAAGVDAPTRAIFCGPSGCGKTLAVRWIGWKLGLPVAVLALDRIVTSYLGATADKLAKAIEEATREPSILFLDEIDGLTGVRGGESSKSGEGEMARVTSSLLQRLDWLPSAQIVIAATNLPDAVDSAIRRRLPSRIDFPLPCDVARLRMVDTWLARAPVTEALKHQIVELTEGYGGAAVRAAAMAAAREAMLDAARGVGKTRELPGIRGAAE